MIMSHPSVSRCFLTWVDQWWVNPRVLEGQHAGGVNQSLFVFTTGMGTDRPGPRRALIYLWPT